jgi:1-acyl-sn-glycerol-3-phosphate acyltransferase
MPLEVNISEQIEANGTYLFCPNHASYLDIPIMGNTPTDFMYVGKNAMEKVPVFGYMYRKLHITVDRSNLRSKHSTFVRAKDAIEHGRSLVIFPEGGVFGKNPPVMIPFKNGAFKIAIEKQIPIVPVSIPHNWIILPDDGRYLFTMRKAALIYHDPIDTQGLTLSDLDALKEKVYQVIDKEIRKSHNDLMVEES